MLDPESTSILTAGREAHVAFAGQQYPVVSPVLYAPVDGHVAFFVAAGTVKARQARRADRAAVVVRAAGRAVSLTGPVVALDVLRPGDAPAALRRLGLVGRAFAGFTARNAVDLLAFGRDAARGQIPMSALQRRVLVVVEVDAVAVVDGMAVTAAAGQWAGSLPDVAPRPPMSSGRPAVVAVDAGERGVVALPASWDADAGRAQVPAALVQLAGLRGAVTAAIVVDDYGSPGPAAKRGAMFRGTGRVHRRDDRAWIDIVAERAAAWDGTDVASAALDAGDVA